MPYICTEVSEEIETALDRENMHLLTALCVKAETSKEWMCVNLPSYILPDSWPPNSPDLNSLGNYVYEN